MYKQRERDRQGHILFWKKNLEKNNKWSPAKKKIDKKIKKMPYEQSTGLGCPVALRVKLQTGGLRPHTTLDLTHVKIF